MLSEKLRDLSWYHKQRGESDARISTGCGCASLVTVLSMGLGLSLFGAAIGGGCSLRVPFTEANVSAAGSVGHKDASRRALADYLADRVGSSRDFVDATQSLTIGPAEGIALEVVGHQEGAPWIDLYLKLATRESVFRPGVVQEPRNKD